MTRVAGREFGDASHLTAASIHGWGLPDALAFHGTRRALKKDCERYNALVIRGGR